MLQQILGIDPIAAIPIGRCFPWRCRVGDQGATRLGHRHRETSLQGPVALWERVIAAGIEDNDIDFVAGVSHRSQDIPNRHRPGPRLYLRADQFSNRDEIILPIDLHAVSSKIEQAQAALAELKAERFDIFLHGLQVRIEQSGHVKSEAFKGRRHICSIIDWIR